MRKIIVVAILMIFTLSCKQHKEEIINHKYEPVTFKELDSINSKSIIEIKEYLKKKGFVFFTKQSDSEQWKLYNQEEVLWLNYGAEDLQKRLIRWYIFLMHRYLLIKDYINMTLWEALHM